MKTVRHLLALSISSALAFSAIAQESNGPSDDDVEVVEVYGAVSSFGATKSQTPIVEMAFSTSPQKDISFGNIQ